MLHQIAAIEMSCSKNYSIASRLLCFCCFFHLSIDMDGCSAAAITHEEETIRSNSTWLPFSGGLIESSDCPVDRATFSLHQQAGPLARSVQFWKCRNVVCLPSREGQMYDYKAVPNAAPIYFRSLFDFCQFCKAPFGPCVLEFALGMRPMMLTS